MTVREDRRDHARRECGDEGVDRITTIKRHPQILDFALDCVQIPCLERTDERVLRNVPGLTCGAEPGRQTGERHHVRGPQRDLAPKSTISLLHIRVEPGLAHLAVADHVDPNLLLVLDNLGDRLAHARVELRTVNWPFPTDVKQARGQSSGLGRLPAWVVRIRS
jgi:hypothetical protein